MAVEVRGGSVAAKIVLWAVVLFWIGRNGSYVGRNTCVGTAGAHEASRKAQRNMVEVDLFQDMGAILPVDNCRSLFLPQRHSSTEVIQKKYMFFSVLLCLCGKPKSAAGRINKPIRVNL